MSVALLASLFTITAGSAIGAATDFTFTVTGAGNIPTTGTSGAVTIAVGEGQATGWGDILADQTVANTLVFTLSDAAGGTGTVEWTGTPVISGAPGSLGTFTVTKAANVLTVTFTTNNIIQIENFSITGLTIDTTAAPAGALRAIVTHTAGAGTGTVPTGTGTASGVLTNDEAVGSVALEITCDTGSFDFAVTSATNGNLAIAAPDAETRGITGIAGTCAGANTVATVPALTSFHAADTVVTQSVGVLGLLSGIATVVPTLTETAVAASVFPQPGEFNNSLTGASVTITESAAATLATNSVVTFTLDTAGVLFSSAPSATPGGAVMRLNGAAVSTAVPCALSFDRTSCSVTVTTKSTAATTVSLSAIIIDIGASVLQGTKIGVNVTTNPVVPVVVTSKTIATVARVAVGVAAQPTIYINENDQSTGVITLTESRAGVLTAAAGNNYFGICLDSTGATFTRAPWATVTTGDLKIRSGVVGATTVQGNQTSTICVSWVVYSASTVASTIEIRGADASNVILPAGANNGPRVSLAGNAVPGANSIRVLNGSQANVEGNAAAALVTVVSNAIHAYRNQPVVAAVTQTVVARGSTRAPLGNITITETQAGQFKAGEDIALCIEDLATPAGNADVARFKFGNTADNPLVTTNVASGLLASLTSVDSDCITIAVSQQATGTLGVITISNMWVFVLGDAPNANLLVNAESIDLADGGTNAVYFNQVVSPARIGAVSVAEATINRGLNTRTGFGFGTEIVARGAYVTIRSRASGSAAGDLVQIWVKTASTAWTLETSRRVSPNGFMYYSGKVLNAGYRYYRVAYPTGAISNTVRAFGR